MRNMQFCEDIQMQKLYSFLIHASSLDLDQERSCMWKKIFRKVLGTIL